MGRAHWKFFSDLIISWLSFFSPLASTSPPCQSTRFLQLADPSLIQWRSYRRGAYQQLRRSGVSPTISDFMMRWAQRKNTRNGNEETYDDLCPDDTVNATSKL